MKRYTPHNSTPTPNITVAASQTNTVVSRPTFDISNEGSLNFVVKITAAATTVTNAITAKLQTATGFSDTFVDSKTVAISGNGDFYIKIQATLDADKTYLPLLNIGRIVVSTGVGDTTQITSVKILQGS